jgi:hypothetical protein
MLGVGLAFHDDAYEVHLLQSTIVLCRISRAHRARDDQIENREPTI